MKVKHGIVKETKFLKGGSSLSIYSLPGSDIDDTENEQGAEGDGGEEEDENKADKLAERGVEEKDETGFEDIGGDEEKDNATENLLRADLPFYVRPFHRTISFSLRLVVGSSASDAMIATIL